MKTVKSLFLKKNDVDAEFFRKFKVSLRLEILTNLDAKGAKRSIKIWAIKFQEKIFKNIFFSHKLWAVKDSFSTYICSKEIYSCGQGGDNIETTDLLDGCRKVAWLFFLYSAGCTDIFKAWDNIHKGDFLH